jgi:phosphoglycolate phosphatase
VLFDLDGTLIDSRRDLADAVNHVRGSFGLPPLDPTTVFRYVGDGARALVERALGAERADLWNSGVERFLAYYDAHLLEHTRLYPAMRELLEAMAAAGVTASVLTNKPEGFSRRILAGLGCLDRFVGVVGGDTLTLRKPDPSGAFSLLAAAGVDRADAMIVGDSPVDAATAAAGSIAFCGVAWGFNPAALDVATVPIATTVSVLRDVVLGHW